MKMGKFLVLIYHIELYAHQMIEESMLAANVCAANFMHKHYKFGVYRVHEKPEELKLESLKSFSLKGFSSQNKDTPLALINKCLQFSSKNKLNKVLQTVVLQSLKRAEYSTKKLAILGYSLIDTHTSPHQ